MQSYTETVILSLKTLTACTMGYRRLADPAAAETRKNSSSDPWKEG